MNGINFMELIHKNLTYTVQIPGGPVQTGSAKCLIPIRIPRIQRDYAEGRETESIQRKRWNMLKDIIQVLYGSKTNLSFDFIYGYMMDDKVNCLINNYNDYDQHKNVVFDPLDGQQRLTTLFLFYWFYGRHIELQKNPHEQAIHSLFIYETRPSSEEFCNWLVTKNAKSIIDSWMRLVSNIETANKKNELLCDNEKNPRKKAVLQLRYPQKKTPRLMDYIMTLDDFKWDWRDDPNIRSMIVVIESIYKLMTEMGLDYDTGIKCNVNLDNITFQLLDHLECDGEELFEKMNARGKALTDFEEIKSTLEEEMELQGIAGKKIASDWQEQIDNKWVNYYWKAVIKTLSPTLDDVRKVEDKLRRLVLHMIAKSFFNEDIIYTKSKHNDAVNYGDRLKKCITDNMDNVVNCYVDYALHERSLKKPLTLIKFDSVFSDIENMLYDENGKGAWKDVFQYVDSTGFHFHRGNGNATTLLDDYLTDKPTRNVRVMFYAVMAYLHRKPATIITADSTGIELANFREWMRFIRNVYLPENKTAGLNEEDDANKAIQALDEWLKEYFAKHRTSDTDMLVFIRDHIKNNPYTQEKNRIEEEALKASLRLDKLNKIKPDWDNAILNAENNYYLWGQIIAPLSWSFSPITKQYDLATFEKYTKRLNAIFSANSRLDNSSTDIKIVQAMLCFKDYRTIDKGLGSLRRANVDRDYSWKRYLRDDNGLGLYGELFKTLIDDWEKYYSSYVFDVFLDEFIKNKKSSILKTDWRYFIINAAPDTLLVFLSDTVRTNTRHIYESQNDGHVYYFRSETMKTSNRYEIVTSYIYMTLKSMRAEAKIEHINGNGGAHVEFQYNTDTIRVSSVSVGLYDISKNGTTYVSGADIATLESELIKLGVITSL